MRHPRIILAVLALFSAGLLIAGSDRYIGEAVRATDINTVGATTGQALTAASGGGGTWTTVGAAADVTAIQGAPVVTTTATAAFSGEANMGALATGVVKATVSGGTATMSTVLSSATSAATTIPVSGAGGNLAQGFLATGTATTGYAPISDGAGGTAWGAVGGNDVTWTALTTSITMAAGTNYLANTATYIEETLPTSPSANDMVRVWNVGVGNVYYYAGATNKVQGTTIVQGVVRRGYKAVFRYIDAATGWAVDMNAAPAIWSTSLGGHWNPETGTTTVSGKCSSLADLSTVGLTMVQGTAGLRPVNTTYNGHAVHAYDTSDGTYLQRADDASMDTTSWTLTAWLKPANNASTYGFWDHSNSASTGISLFMQTLGRAGLRVGAGVYYSAIEVFSGAPVIVQYKMDQTSDNAALIRIDRHFSAAALPVDQSVSSDPITIGATTFAGAPANHFEGSIGSITYRQAAVVPVIARMDEDFTAALYE